MFGQQPAVDGAAVVAADTDSVGALAVEDVGAHVAEGAERLEGPHPGLARVAQERVGCSRCGWKPTGRGLAACWGDVGRCGDCRGPAIEVIGFGVVALMVELLLGRARRVAPLFLFGVTFAARHRVSD